MPGKIGRPGSATIDREGERTCRMCGETKKLSEFHRRGNGYQSNCKPCQIKAVQETANPIRIIAYAQKYSATHRDERRLYALWWRAHNLEKARERERKFYERRRAR